MREHGAPSAPHEGAPPCVFSSLELRSYSGSPRAQASFATYLLGQHTGLMQKKLPTADLVTMAPIGAKAHSDMITLTLRSQLLSSQRLNSPSSSAGTFRYRGQPLLKLGSLFSPSHSRSLRRLLATYLLTYRAPGQREKATYLLFGTTGRELGTT